MHKWRKKNGPVRLWQGCDGEGVVYALWRNHPSSPCCVWWRNNDSGETIVRLDDIGVSLADMMDSIRSVDMGKFVQRVAAVDKKTKEKRHVQDKTLAKDFPAVADYLFTDRWEDGEERETSTLLAFAEDGQVKICLNDRANERSLWAAGDGLWTALQALEGRLGDANAEWRAKKPQTGSNAKGRGKGG